MKLKNNFTLTGLAGEYVAVPTDGAENFHGIVKLNESGAEVFRAFSEGQSEEQAAKRLMDKYTGLDEETAKKAVKIVVDQLWNAGLLEN